MEVIDIITIIQERMGELNRNSEWCLNQIVGENRLNINNDTLSIQNWVRRLRDNETRINELKKILERFSQ